MSVCRHELGVQPPPPGNSNPGYYKGYSTSGRLCCLFVAILVAASALWRRRPFKRFWILHSYSATQFLLLLLLLIKYLILNEKESRQHAASAFMYAIYGRIIRVKVGDHWPNDTFLVSR